MSLSARVLTGLALGIVTGVFFGEEVAFLESFGRAFVVLLQMTVLPFVSVALMHSLGGLRLEDARALAGHAGGVLLLIWGATLVVVTAFPLAFPTWEVASFFSSSLVEAGEPFDPIALYLPSNPFRAFADGVVPAVVVFSVALGVALMTTERKDALIESLGALSDTLQRVAGFVVSLAPYGVFAIAGHAAGTMQGDELIGLQVYAAAYVVVAVVLSAWVLPMLVVALTPFSYAQIAGHARAAFLTAFATGSVFVVLPILAQRSRELLESSDATREGERFVDVIVPIAFTLSSAGKLLALAFIPFAGWISGFPLPAARLPEFLVTGVFSFFASTAVAIPFLLDLFRIPADTFQLFLVADNIVGNRFGSLLAAVHILAVTLLGACGVSGSLRLQSAALLRWGVVGAVLVFGGLLAVRSGFELTEHRYRGYERFVGRSLLLPPAPAREPSADEVDAAEPGPALERIRRRGRLRVGWTRDSLPFAFRNDQALLVGFDIEMAHVLARDLEVDLELVGLDLDRVPGALDERRVDLVMSGMAVTPHRLEAMGFSAPYMECTLAFVVPDHRRDAFSSREAVQAHERLRLGVPRVDYYADKVRRYLPEAEIVELDSAREFFREGHQELDALVYSAEGASAWTLIYPRFAVAVPHPDLLRVPLGYAVARDDVSFKEFLDHWIVLKTRDLTVQRLFDYWFRGIDPPSARPPRWSVLRNVLGWGLKAGPGPTRRGPAQAWDP